MRNVTATVLFLCAMPCLAEPPASQSASAYPALQKRLALLEQENARLKKENAALEQKLAALQDANKQLSDQAAAADAKIAPGDLKRGMSRLEVRKALGKVGGQAWEEADGVEDVDTLTVIFSQTTYSAVLPGEGSAHGSTLEYRCLFSKRDGNLVNFQKQTRGF